MSCPLTYTVFHLNMAFSSIEESDRKTVIDRCYWPLLRLAKTGFPIGIEATSYSLQAIEVLDSAWISELKALIKAGAVEFVGSGYVQMIAPLVPPEVTRWNLKLAQDDYEALLGIKPSIALINEQAYAPGLVPLYLEAGFQAIMMDCSEPASHNVNWKKEFAQSPQYIEGAGGAVIPVLWSDAISFQKFQRYAHGELEADEYFEFLTLQLAAGVKAFPLYTSDAEVFDYRPGRFASEAEQSVTLEYERIHLLLKALVGSGNVKLVLPSAALKLVGNKSNPIKLETASAPIPVKKQRKYNLLRWAVSGRSDLALNTHCARLFEQLKGSKTATADDWRRLCGYWASDFRTHITENRWKKLCETVPEAPAPDKAAQAHKRLPVSQLPADVRIKQDKHLVCIETGTMHLVLNAYRGLAIHSCGFGAYEGQRAGAPAENALIGTLAHGFYDDIAYGADFYSGHFIFEPASEHKGTDLMRVTPTCHWVEEIGAIEVCCSLQTPWGKLEKIVRIFTQKHRVEVSYTGEIPLPLDGSFRLGHMALNPRAFDVKSLYYAAHNGGDTMDQYPLYAQGLADFDHGAPVSRLVSGNTGLGMTGGILELGDKHHFVRLGMARTDAAGVGLVTCRAVDDSFFLRAAVSVGEVDETCRPANTIKSKAIQSPILRYSIELGKHD
ncbi:MAG: hypothetical protein JKY34_00280 [Kordiimonadaceae bacterium]|nr:hypothetical protein [Kordiimonadaceae bacterium]